MKKQQIYQKLAKIVDNNVKLMTLIVSISSNASVIDGIIYLYDYEGYTSADFLCLYEKISNNTENKVVAIDVFICTIKNEVEKSINIQREEFKSK